jgi:hypothetical protein
VNVWVPDIFAALFSEKLKKRANNSTISEAGEKISMNLDFLEFQT